MTLQRAVTLLALLAAAMAAGTPATSFADEIDDAQQLVKQGNLGPALDKVNAYLAPRPKDARGRFLKGVILAEQNKAAEAIKVFTTLTEDYPELPEPYNNLAVLYASQQQYDKARHALEMAIQTHPSYATAHENLGDIYAKMASQAYDRALQLDKNNSGAQTKLSLIKEIFPVNARAQRVLARTEAPRPTVVAAATPAATTAPAAPAAPVKPQPPAKEVEKPAEKAVDKPEPKADPTQAITKTVQGWAQAWSAKRTKDYLSFYAPDFRPPNAQTRDEWEKTRHERIAAPKRIQVTVSSIKVNVTDDRRASATFRQSYKAGSLNSSTTKTLVLIKSGQKWLIQQERIGS